MIRYRDLAFARELKALGCSIEAIEYAVNILPWPDGDGFKTDYMRLSTGKERFSQALLKRYLDHPPLRSSIIQLVFKNKINSWNQDGQNQA